MRHAALIATTAIAWHAAALDAASPEAPRAAAAPTLPALRSGTWLRAETTNFTLFGNVPQARLMAIALRLEAFRRALEWLHPGSRSSPRETSVYVFSDATTGWRYTPARSEGGHHLGVNAPYDVPNYVTVAAPVDEPPLDLLYHAYAHQFLDDNFPRLPLTVTEGLAEFYSGFTAAPEGSLIGLRNADHVLWLQKHEAWPLSRQFALEARSALLTDAAGRRTFMAGSWSLMHYLVSGSGEKRASLPLFLELLQRGTAPGEAAVSAFGMALDSVQAEVSQYVRRDRFLPLRVRSDARAPTASPGPGSIDLHPMAQDEVLAALGEILAHAKDPGATDAEAHVQAALRLNPEQPRAHAALGYMRYSQDRFVDAIPSLEAAVAIDPDAMSCYLLAKSLLKVHAHSAPVKPATQAAAGPGSAPGTTAAPGATAVSGAPPTPPWLKRARDLLGQAIALRPRFAAPYVTLGATHTYADGDVGAGIELLQKAHVMLPARMDIVGNLVYLLLRAGDFVRAQALVDGVLARGGDEEALRAARAALATFREHLEARRSLYKTRETRETPEDKARSEAFRQEQAEGLRDALAEAKDPETRARIERALEALESPPPALTYNKAVEIFNQAVDRANRRDYTAAIALLEDLRLKVEDKELREKIDTLLERFRQDASRLQQAVE